MIRIEPVEPADESWMEWRTQCRTAHEKLRSIFAFWREDLDPPVPKPSPSSTLYGSQRDRIAKEFFFKCAYCEGKLDPTVRRGQLDHYRPQKRVRNASGEIVMLRWGSCADERPHPGYYWLAYEWTNLLPVCSACNTRTKSFQGRMGGKSDLFPTADGTYAGEPDMEDQEKPLLLNPWRDVPGNHMLFCWENGKIAPFTPEGITTVELLDLNRDGLVDERRSICEQSIEMYQSYASHRLNSQFSRSAALRRASLEEVMQLNGEFMQWRRGNAAYSAFRVAALEWAESTLRREFQQAA